MLLGVTELTFRGDGFSTERVTLTREMWMLLNDATAPHQELMCSSSWES